MTDASFVQLSRRERQIMDVIYARGEATAAEVLADLPEPSTDASVRKLLRILEEKGHVDHERRGHSYVYRATIPHREASRSALRHVMDVFFQGSPSKAAAALLQGRRLSKEEADELARLIEKSARRGR